MKKDKYDKNNTYNTKEKRKGDIEEPMSEIEAFYFEKELHRKKREIAKRKKKEKRSKEDRWN